MPEQSTQRPNIQDLNFYTVKTIKAFCNDVGLGSQEMCNIYEGYFEHCLELLRRGHAVVNWRKTIRNSADDVNGIDFYVDCVDLKGVPFQIDSSKAGGNYSQAL